MTPYLSSSLLLSPPKLFTRVYLEVDVGGEKRKVVIRLHHAKIYCSHLLKHWIEDFRSLIRVRQGLKSAFYFYAVLIYFDFNFLKKNKFAEYFTRFQSQSFFLLSFPL